MNEVAGIDKTHDSEPLPFKGYLAAETAMERHKRYTQLVCLVVLIVAVITLLVSLFFSLFVSWQLWSGSALAVCAIVIPSVISWRLAQAGRSYLASYINICTLAIVISYMYWQAPYFALYLIFLFIMTVVHILLGSRQTFIAGTFLFANTLLYAIVNHNHMYAPDGQVVTVDYGSFAVWWLLIGGTAWLVSFLYQTMQHDNHILHLHTSALQKAQRQLGESEERYRALSQAAFEGIVLHEQDTILEVNQTLTDLFGYEATALVGRSLQELIPDLTATAPDGHTSIETVAMRLDGTTFPVEHQSRNFVYRGHPIEVSAIRDISARKKTEEALRHSQQQLLQAQKLESLGRLAGGIAHDFNNLLTVILSYSDLLTLAIGEDNDRHGYIEQIKEAGIRASALTRQLLAFSRQQIVQPQLLNLNQSVLAMGKLLKRLIGEDIELQTVLEPDVAQVLIDPGQFEQIVMNLALNARDAMPGGGTLTLETANVILQENAIWDQPSFAVETGEYVMLAVSDCGIGMDAATQSRIFEPFFTTKEPGRGTGLGLATIYGIVQQSGGYIWVYSTPNVGTTFKVYLPRSFDAGEQTPSFQDVDVSLDSYWGSETILVVEDDAQVRCLVRQVLEHYGYSVLTAGDGKEALTLLEKRGNNMDVILTDVIMPRMGGVELLTAIKSTYRKAKLIAMSGYTDRVAIQQGIHSMCDRYVQKPFTPGNLVRTIREVLGPRSPS